MTVASTAGSGAALDDSYRLCRALHRRHGTTYYWATRLLPADRRRYVHALYGFCRYADEIVDDLGSAAPVELRREVLTALGDEVQAGLAAGWSAHPVVAAVVDTIESLRIDPDAIRRFLNAMAMDLSVTTYATWDDLCSYMDGSAAVIGEMMLGVLEPADAPAALGPARDLGLAFQLTNFLRDVGEDLDRGRLYLPLEDVARFGADPWARRVDQAWVALLRFQIDRAQSLYCSADRGIALLPPRSAACVRAARILYSGILDRITAQGYDVFSTRARVPSSRKASVAARCLAGTIGSRKP